MTESALHLIRPEVRALQPVAHGSVAAAELVAAGLDPSSVVDFSVNTHPMGPAACVLAAIETANWSRYPGDDERPLREALAARAGVTPDHVALGNGSAELLWLIALAVLRPGDRAAVVGPTFGEYRRAAGVTGAEVQEVQDPRDALNARLLFLCNPNNPTGAYVGPDQVEQLLAEEPGRVLVLDEAYAAFVPTLWRSEPLLSRYPNLVILRSMTKDHAVPGLRLGYLLAVPDVARAIEAVRPPWSVNAGALRAGLAALTPEGEAHVARGHTVVQAARQFLTDELTGLGWAVAPSAANFVLMDVGNGAAFRRVLLPHGVVVRDCASFGLPHQVRIACRPIEECQRLVDAVSHVFPSGPHG